MRGLIVALMVFVLAACSEPDSRFVIPTQKWNDVVVEVQPRPSPVRIGMDEFLVLTTTEHGRPVHDLIVSLRSDLNSEWEQAIQDGFSGVHRRAIHLSGNPVLYVELRKKRSDESVVLEFPLTYEGE